MIYDWRELDFEELPFLDWTQATGNSFVTHITKNGRRYTAQLIALPNSWRLRLIHDETERTILELRFRNVSFEDAMLKAEFYILEHIE